MSTQWLNCIVGNVGARFWKAVPLVCIAILYHHTYSLKTNDQNWSIKLDGTRGPLFFQGSATEWYHWGHFIMRSPKDIGIYNYIIIYNHIYAINIYPKVLFCFIYLGIFRNVFCYCFFMHNELYIIEHWGEWICIWSINYIIFIHAWNGWGLNRKMEMRKSNLGTPEVVHLSLKLIWVDDKLLYLSCNRQLFMEQHRHYPMRIFTRTYINTFYWYATYSHKKNIIRTRYSFQQSTCRKPCILLPLLCSPHSPSPSLLLLSFVAVLHLKCFWGKSEKKKLFDQRIYLDKTWQPKSLMAGAYTHAGRCAHTYTHTHTHTRRV